MVSSDAVIGSRQLLNVLIKGAGSGGDAVTGLQIRLDEMFDQPSLPTASKPQVQLWYKYDASTQGLVKLQSPLTRPLVTLIANSRVKQKFFNEDRHPTENVFAWGWKYDIQFDVWANTPTQVAAIVDALSRAIVAMKKPLWANFRIGLSIESFEDAPYEIDQSIFRMLGRGTLTAVDTTPSD